MQNEILTAAAEAHSQRDAAQVVLSAVVESHANPRDVQVDEVKRQLVAALRVWRAHHGRQSGGGAGGQRAREFPQAVRA